MDNLNSQQQEENKPKWNSLWIWLVVLVFAGFIFAKDGSNSMDYNPRVTIYSTSGEMIPITKIWRGRVAISSAVSQSVSIASAGFTSVAMVQVTGENNTSTATAMPICSLNSFTTSAVLLNTVVAQNYTVSILGLNILPFVAPTNFTGMYANIIVYGN